MAPRRLQTLLEDGEVTPTEFALLMYVGLADGEFDGIATTLDHLSALLSCSTKTISRALAKLGRLGLVVSDLRQGQRTPFRVRLGEPALASDQATSDTTSDTDPPREVRSAVRSDLGHAARADSRDPAPGAASRPNDFGPSRARVQTETDTETKAVLDGAVSPIAPQIDDARAVGEEAEREPTLEQALNDAALFAVFVAPYVA